jgi:hypothetical protein
MFLSSRAWANVSFVAQIQVAVAQWRIRAWQLDQRQGPDHNFVDGHV